MSGTEFEESDQVDLAYHPPEFVLRIFTPFDYSSSQVMRLLSQDFVSRTNLKVHVNVSGECDAALVWGYSSIGAEVICPKRSVYKAVVEPWLPGLF